MRGHINERLKSGLANSGRAAGMGISEDRYDEDSGYPGYRRDYGPVRFPHDSLTAEERTALNGPVVTYRAAGKEETNG